jgi:hypothetical protein
MKVMLYERDYNLLTEVEIQKLADADEYLRKNTVKSKIITPDVFKKYHDLKPNAAYFYESLFPNNYLNPTSLADKELLEKIWVDFDNLLRSKVSERDVLNFINVNKYFNLIASIFFAGYTFGHHDAYLFKEFELTSTFKADYLLVGKNSHGYHLVFIELENPTGSITIDEGEFGLTTRKGIKQVRDWDKWLESNYHSLFLIFNKFKNPRKDLPNEFRSLNKSRLNYVVIAGRRSDFSDNTYEEKRRLLRQNNINLLHYDNLMDYFKFLQTVDNY